MSSPVNSLGRHTARGVAMLTAQTVFGKLLSSASQLILAWLLAPEAFGLVALAYTITSFSSIIEQIGLREILIREQRRFDRWVSSAFWLAAALGYGTALVTVVMGPIAAWIYGEPKVIELVWVMALAAPFSSLSQICEARLERDLRFGRVTMIQFVTQVAMVVLSVLFAALGAGALSFVLPRAVIAPIRFVYLMMLTKPRLRLSLQLHRWRVLVGRGLPITVSALFTMVNANADYFILGLLATKGVVGLYYFAYSQSTQFVMIFANNLMRVLMPSLSTMREDPRRQVAAYLRAARLIATAAAPLCLMQAALAGPVIRLFFKEDWEPAVILLQILSSAAFFGVVSWPTVSLLMAQGRYRTRMVLAAAAAVVFTASVLVGALAMQPSGQTAIGAALGVIVFRLIVNPLQAFVACRPARVSYARVLRVFFVPAASAVVAVIPVWWGAHSALSALGASEMVRDIVQGALVVVVSPLIYAAWVRTTQRALWNEGLGLVSGLVPGRFKRMISKSIA